MKKEYQITKKSLTHSDQKTINSFNDYLVVLNRFGSYQVEFHNKAYICTGNDILLLKPRQKVLIKVLDNENVDLTIFSIHERLLQSLSTEQFIYKEKLDYVPYEIAIVHTQTDTAIVLKNLLNRISSLKDEKLRFGLDVYENSLLNSFLIILLRACVISDQVHRDNQKKELEIDEVYLFIRNHLTEDLSLNHLQEIFFVSSEHLSRKFKESVGISIHQYIIKSRIDLSKKYIMDGYPINQIYQLCGFNSYNHFFKAFKANENMTPIQYRKKFRNELSF